MDSLDSMAINLRLSVRRGHRDRMSHHGPVVRVPYTRLLVGFPGSPLAPLVDLEREQADLLWRLAQGWVEQGIAAALTGASDPDLAAIVARLRSGGWPRLARVLEAEIERGCPHEPAHPVAGHGNGVL
jgi:hypothetical protein